MKDLNLKEVSKFCLTDKRDDFPLMKVFFMAFLNFEYYLLYSVCELFLSLRPHSFDKEFYFGVRVIPYETGLNYF